MPNVPISGFTVPANTVGIGLTGYSLTGSSALSMIDLDGTWNTSGTPTAFKLNITETGLGSNASSLLMDLRVGGASQFSVSKAGVLSVPLSGGLLGAGNFYLGGAGVNVFFGVASGGNSFFNINSTGVGSLTARSNSTIGWNPSATSANGGADTIISRRGAANLRLGAADAASPVAQTLSVQSVVAGTSNTAGANLTITGSQGTGTGAGGSIIFQVAPAGSSGTAQNALATALTINSARNLIVAGNIFNTDGVSGIQPNTSNIFYIDMPGGGLTARNNAGSFAQVFNFATSGALTIGPTSAAAVIVPEAANTLALRNSTNRQVSRIYSTYTDASNGSWVEISTNLYGADQAGVMRKANGSGTSVTPDLYLGSDISNGGIFFRTSNTTRWQFNSAGHFLAQTDNSVDIGASGATRPRDVYVAGRVYTSTVQAGGTAGTGVVFRSTGGSGISQIDANGSFYVAYATTLPAGGTTGRGLHFSSNTTNFGVFFGSGAPTLSAAQGSLYLRSDGTTTNDRMYVNTDGATTWTAVTTVA